MKDVSTRSFCKEAILDDSPQRVKNTATVLQVFCFLKCFFPHLLLLWNFPFSTRTYLTQSLNSKFLQKPFRNSDDLSKKMLGLVEIIKIQVKYKLKHSITGNIWAWRKGISCKKNSTCTRMHCFFPFIHYLCKIALDIFWHILHSLRNSVWGHIHKTVPSGGKKGNLFYLKSDSILM